jgi:hypothetical protein
MRRGQVACHRFKFALYRHFQPLALSSDRLQMQEIVAIGSRSPLPVN